MLLDSGLPKTFWAEAMSTAVYIQNRCTHRSTGNKTPEELWTGRKPSVQHIRIFGCKAYVYEQRGTKGKMEARAVPMIHIGYFRDKKAYRLYDPKRETFIASKDPKFLEQEKGAILLEKHKEDNIPVSTENEGITIFRGNENVERNHQEESRDGEDHDERHRYQNREGNLDETENEGRELNHIQNYQFQSQIRRSTRQTRQVEKLQIIPNAKSYQCEEEMIKEKIPQSYAEAINCKNRKKWEEAIEEELASHETMKTWKVVKRNPDMRVIKSRWVFSKKESEIDNTVRYKARLVAVGCTQSPGIDFDENYSPVLIKESLRMILAVANQRGMTLRQLDVKAVYLHGEIEEDIYMEIPAGMKGITTNNVCKLQKAIYGLKQSGREWNKTLDKILTNKGFKRLESDRCVYTLERGREMAILGVYVDDFLLAATNKTLTENIVRDMQKNLNVKDLGEPKMILGLRIRRDIKKQEISIDQESSIEELIEKFNMGTAKIAHSNGKKLAVGESERAQGDYRTNP